MTRLLFAALLTLLSTPSANAQGKQENRWEKAIAAFEARDAKDPPAPGGNLFVGSSSVRGWKSLAKDFPKAHVLNRGFGGSQLVDVLFHLERVVLAYRPARVFLYEGDNDVASRKSPEHIAKEFVLFSKRVHKALPKTKIYFLSIKPSPSRWKLWPTMVATNRLIERLCKKKKWLTYIDVAGPMIGADGLPKPEIFLKDELHMNAKGYALWAKAVRPHVLPKAR